MKKYEVWTDGGCTPNPGKGGYGIILNCDGEQSFYVGGEGESTNNRMEFTAVIAAARLLPAGCEATIHTDSQLVIDVLTGACEGKITKPFIPLFEEASLDKRIHLKWVKGHSGQVQNELCDRLATWATNRNASEKGFDSPAWGPVRLDHTALSHALPPTVGQPRTAIANFKLTATKQHGKWSPHV